MELTPTNRSLDFVGVISLSLRVSGGYGELHRRVYVYHKMEDRSYPQVAIDNQHFALVHSLAAALRPVDQADC